MNTIFISFYTIGWTLLLIIVIQKSGKISSELSIYFSFLELAPVNFWVDKLEEVISDAVALRPMS